MFRTHSEASTPCNTCTNHNLRSVCKICKVLFSRLASSFSAAHLTSTMSLIPWLVDACLPVPVQSASPSSSGSEVLDPFEAFCLRDVHLTTPQKKKKGCLGFALFLLQSGCCANWEMFKTSPFVVAAGSLFAGKSHLLGGALK